MTPHQATVIAIGGRALLIEGPPGSGKSSLALALIDRGARLIGDDSVMLETTTGQLFAHPHPNTQGLLEVRGLGLVHFDICDSAPVALVLSLDPEAMRHIEAAETVERGGISLPLLRLWPDSPVLALKAELALQNFGLPCQNQGIDR
jgi:serine kinase of HPr protein (carbohydrate metabolism regulator)